MLIEEQSFQKLLSKAEEARTGSASSRIVIAFSQQSLASVSALSGEPPGRLLRRLATLLKQELGATYVIDMGSAQQLCLQEACQEFVHR